MALTPNDVRRIAELARLELGADEAGAMLEQLNGFFRIVEQMSAVDTSGVEPLYTPLAAVRTRTCACATTWSPSRRARARTSTARRRSSDGLFLVPKVIE